MAPMVSGGETTGGLKAKPRGAPASTAQFADLASDPAALSCVEIGLTKVMRGEKYPEEPMESSRRRKSP